MNVYLDGLTFDDVLLLPGYSQVKREDIDLSTRLTKNITLSIPLLSSPMDTVTDAKLAIALAIQGGIGIIHRNFSIEQQVLQVRKVKKITPNSPTSSLNALKAPNSLNTPTVDQKGRLRVGAAVGVGKDLENRLKALVTAEIDVILVDSAHGFSKWIIETTQYIKKNYPRIPLISGNVATQEGAQALIKVGADILRVGIGPGSICTTRVISGMGVPQITAIKEAVSVAKKHNIPVIADGGIRLSGDITKALACGASTVMIGSLFAGCKEAPGKMMRLEKNKKQVWYKYYRGMGSIAAMKEGAASRYGQEINKGKKLIAEGVEGLVPYKGTVEEFVSQMIGGLKAGMYYVGAKSIPDLWQKARFVRITPAAITESHPHSIIVTNTGENY